MTNVNKNRDKTSVYFGKIKRFSIFASDLAKHQLKEVWVSG